MKIAFDYNELILNCSNNINKKILDLLNTGLGCCFYDFNNKKNKIYLINKIFKMTKKVFKDKNVGKLKYQNDKKNKNIKIFGNKFVKYNKNKAIIIINNKKEVLTENIEIYKNIKLIKVKI